jgi:U3 small nucleolar RNA-associated protein 20
LHTQDHEPHFYATLEQQLNLSPVFIKFVKTAGPLSASMPLLLHNWEEIIQIWIVALDESDEEGLLAVLECVLDLYFARKTVLTRNYSLLQKITTICA